ncbi:acyl-CoA thioesterase [Microbulbifer epialgicus]|uniref:Acyl-CoA thioesterase n=1 Tax=Microbulbifer epialgicus TaxID=393907 RepID=A0ABV4NXH3_9GAMM
MSRVNINFPENIHYSDMQVVGIQDVNCRKHVGHDKLISMLHEIRERFFDYIGKSEMDECPQGYILADLEVQYLGEAFFGDELRFDLAVDELSERSCNIYYRVSRVSDGAVTTPALIARAKTGVVFFDYESRKAIPVPRVVFRLWNP